MADAPVVPVLAHPSEAPDATAMPTVAADADSPPPGAPQRPADKTGGDEPPMAAHAFVEMDPAEPPLQDLRPPTDHADAPTSAGLSFDAPREAEALPTQGIRPPDAQATWPDDSLRPVAEGSGASPMRDIPLTPQPLASADAADAPFDEPAFIGASLELARSAALDGAETTASAAGTRTEPGAPPDAMRVGSADRDAWTTLSPGPAAAAPSGGSGGADTGTTDGGSRDDGRDAPAYALDAASFEWALAEPEPDEEDDVSDPSPYPSDRLDLPTLHPTLERTGGSRTPIGAAEALADAVAAGQEPDGPLAHEAHVQIDDQLAVRVTTHGQRVDVTLQTDPETWRAMADLGPTLAADLATAGFQLGSFQGEDPREERPNASQPIAAQPRSTTGKRVALYRYERYV
jgi:hypothetical protein